MRLREHWALIGYIALVAVTILAVQLYEIHTTREIDQTQRQIVFTAYRDCLHSEALAENQQVLVLSVVALVDQPEFHKLGLRQSDIEFVFRSVLTRIPRFECTQPSFWPPEVGDIPGN